MQFESWQAFWHMGGYALYVWLSFGVTLLAMAGIAWVSAREHRKIMQRTLTEQARRNRIRQARTAHQSASAGAR